MCDRVGFSGAARYILTAPVTLYAASPVSLLPVRGGVLDAPRSRECRGGLDADVRADRLHPRFPRCATSRPPPNASNPAGTARAPFVRREGIAPAESYAAAFVSRPAVGGGVLDAPCSRDRRAGLDADVGLGRLRPRHPRCASLRPPPNVSNPAGTARAPFYTGVRSCPSSQAGRAWKISPYGGCGRASTWNRRRRLSGGGASGTPPLTGGLYTSRCGI